MVSPTARSRVDVHPVRAAESIKVDRQMIKVLVFMGVQYSWGDNGLLPMKYTPRQIEKEIIMFFRYPILAGLILVCGGLSACQTRQSVIPEPLESVTQGMDYLGTWALNDTDNQLFNIVVRPDRTVVSNWSKGARGAQGERGSWKRTGTRLVISYKDGWTDVLSPSRYGISRQSYRPGTGVDGTPSSFGSAVRVTDPLANFCGVFQVGEDGEFVSLLSSGLAYKSDAASNMLAAKIDLVPGTWTLKDNSAMISWSDQSVQRVSWQRGVYVLESEPAGTVPSRMLLPVDGLSYGGRR
tara:strand:+ start:8772 stop:9659 length:888 start_codon:yes stop_codon:yes gene_type:complete